MSHVDAAAKCLCLMPTFLSSLGVTHDGSATHAGGSLLLLVAPAHVGEAFAFAVGHGVGTCTGSAVRQGKAVLRRVCEGAAFILQVRHPM